MAVVNKTNVIATWFGGTLAGQKADTWDDGTVTSMPTDN